MSEVIEQWLCQLYDSEIDDVKGTLSNERLWEKGWTPPADYNPVVDGDLNPHTENIRELEEYLEVLEDLRAGCEHGGCV